MGILGFITRITTDAPGDFAGDESEAELLGILQTSVQHNIVYLLFGIAGLAIARRRDTARTYLLGASVIYFVLFLLGLIGGGDWIPANYADDWLHLVLGAALLGAWYASRDERGRDAVVT